MTDTIPEDVMKAAKSTANAVCAQVAGSHVIIARAIMAERERCAKVAETHYPDDDWLDRNHAGVSIADAVRKGDTP